MNQLLVGLAFMGQIVTAHNTQPVQFDQGAIGMNVTVAIDGVVEKTFAGKLSFHDQTHSWMSVCADVRSPIAPSQMFAVVVKKTSKMGGNIALAGNIVAKYFRAAQTPQQCAGLQLAVWKTIEDGRDGTDFAHGRFQAMADSETMMYAQEYAQVIDENGNAFFLQAQGGDGNSGDSQGGGGSGGQSQMSGG